MGASRAQGEPGGENSSPRARDCPRFVPVATPAAHPKTTKAPHWQGFREIGETGFEPATARPPAGTIWLPRTGSRGVERLRVGRSCPQLRSLCTPDCTPSERECDQFLPAQPCRTAALARRESE